MWGEVEEAAQPLESAPQHRQQDQRQRVVCDWKKTRVGISSKAKGSSQQSSAAAAAAALAPTRHNSNECRCLFPPSGEYSLETCPHEVKAPDCYGE
ncbi:unnamed protein product [Pylaiella littoralis]